VATASDMLSNRGVLCTNNSYKSYVIHHVCTMNIIIAVILSLLLLQVYECMEGSFLINRTGSLT